MNLDVTMDEKFQSELNDSSLRRKSESDSIVRGILSNSIKYNHEKQSGLNRFSFSYLFCFFLGDLPSTLTRVLNGNSVQNDIPKIPTHQQQQHQSKVI